MNPTIKHCIINAVLLSVAAVTAAKAADDITPPASQRFANRNTQAAPDFQKHVAPLLGRLGCNSAKCHGSFQGRGDFRLSLFGFDFPSDYAALLAEASSEAGPRVNVNDPQRSLILRKPTEQVDHEGGKRFALGSWEHHLLLRWIDSGASGQTSGDASQSQNRELASDEADFLKASTRQNHVLVKLLSEPKEILFSDTDQRRQLRIIAVWEDGAREDVTCLARFQTNDDAVVGVDRDGLATSSGAGDTHIIVFYDNGVAAIPVLRPYGDASRERGAARSDTPNVQSSDHPIDRLVEAKLGKLGIVPSELCTDAEFLRRVSIDMTGTLPTPDEVTDFLADSSSDKRNRKIEELLRRPAYAAWWTNKLCDFTGCNPKSISNLLEVAREDGYVKASEWYDWIYERVERNEPYDRLVAGLMLADPSGQEDGMPHFWTRQSLKEPKDTAMSVAHAFLGIQLQCAECHKHPFDRWTQTDFNEFARFFASVTETKRRSAAPEEQELRLLRGERVRLERGDDPRKPVLDWMRDPENPWFARAFVNRVWAGYFHVGVVDPPDQLTPANPPSNPPLLDWLASGFVQSGYDMKWLHRRIVASHAYQRSWKPNASNRNDRRNFSRAIPRRIPAEVVYDALKQTTAATSQQTEVRNNLRRRASGHLSMRMAGTHAMRVFGKPDRSMNCDCERVNEPTLLQAIFTQNDPLVRMRIADSGWIAEIEDAESENPRLDHQTLIQQVWLRTVGRYPNEEEARRATRHLASSNSIAEGVADLMWAMINTKEFLLNH